MAIVVPPDSVGAQAVDPWAVDLALALGRQVPGWEVVLVSFGDPAVSALGERVTEKLLKPHRHDALARSPLGVTSWGLAPALEDADVVVAFDPFTRTGEVASLVAKALDKAVVALVTGRRSSEVGVSLGLFGLVDAVACRTSFSASRMPPGVSVAVLPGGVDHASFAPAPGAREHVLVVGTATGRPATRRLIDAMAPGVPLVVWEPDAATGGWPDEEGPPDRYVALRAGPDRELVRQLYQRAYATVLVPPEDPEDTTEDAVDTERFVPVVLASLACGAPVVAIDGIAGTEFVTDGETGFLCSSIGELAGHAADLSADRELVARMGRRARDEVVARYGIDAVAAGLGRLLAEHVAGRRGPTP